MIEEEKLMRMSAKTEEILRMVFGENGEIPKEVLELRYLVQSAFSKMGLSALRADVLAVCCGLGMFLRKEAPVEYEKMEYEDIRSIGKRLGITERMKKPELIAAIREVEDVRI